MYKCEMCGSMFSEPGSETVCAEDYYGVSSMFSNRNYISFDVCPHCGSEDFRSYSEDADDDRIAYYEKEGDEYVYYDSNEHELYREPA